MQEFSMNFTAVSKAAAEKLIEAFAEIKKKHADLNKGANKLLKAKEIKKLDKDMKDAGTKAGDKMVDDLGKVRASFEAHAQGIQKMMIDCVQLLATAEKAVKRFEEDPSPFEREQVRAITSRAADEIKAKVEEAKEQDLAYGKSWFEYRGYNPCKDGLDEEYAKKSADLKSGLMNDGKPVTAKIKTMGDLQEKVQTLINRVEAAAKRGAKEIAEQRSRAAEMVDEANKIANAIENTKGNNVMVLRNSSDGIMGLVSKTPPDPDAPRLVRDYITNVSSADKFIRERLGAMKRLVDSVKSEFDSDEQKDDEIAKAIKKLGEVQANAKKSYDEEIAKVKKAIEAGAKLMAAKK